jgi:OOP family OmpA-OmpF porin
MRALASLCFLGLVPVGHAQELNNTFYAGAGVGSFSYAEDLTAIDPEFSEFSDYSFTAWKLYGGFNFNQYVGVEGSYWSSGNFSENVVGQDPFFGNFSMSTVLDFRSFSVRGMGYFPLPRGALFGGLGYFEATSDLQFSAVLEDCCEDEFFASTDPFSGFTGQFGAQWSVSSLVLRLEYEWWDIEGGNASVFAVGASWRF